MNEVNVFDSIDQYIEYALQQWEQDNPRPDYDLPGQPPKPEPELIPLQGNGFIVIEPTTDGSHYQLTIKHQGKTIETNLNHVTIGDLIETLLSIQADSRDLHHWHSKYKPMQREHNQKLDQWNKARDRFKQDAINKYIEHSVQSDDENSATN